ncbi:MAG: hypothetical protein JWP81_1331 [Ferruginibacter sp.]|nr:hypothetical protein [Ferruginibacter sp.]
MFHFLQPIWMLAATGIIVPAIIHLWNIQAGKILKVGSIAFFTQSSKKYASSLRIREWWLLIVRCLLIIVLAILLSKPQVNESFDTRREKGWLLLEKGNIAEAYQRFKLVIDSLMQAGYEFHYFNTGFAKENLNDVLKTAGDTISAKALSYRSLIKQLDQLLPPELPVFLFTTNYLNRFAGNRSATSLNLHWNTYTPGDSVSNFIEKAYSISADSIRIIIGNSSPSRTTFSHEDISLGDIENHDIQIDHKNGAAFISYLKDTPVPVDTATMNITIFQGTYPVDAKYLQAAIAAIRQFSKHLIRLKISNKIEDIPTQQDWLFWLSESPPPEKIKADNIFTYQQGEIENVYSWINTTTSINSEEEKIALIKKTSSVIDVHSGQPLWQDGFGDTILSLEETGINVYRLFTHIDPAWNDLPWSARFPQLIYTLLYPAAENNVIRDHDKRTISSAQLLPEKGGQGKSKMPPKYITKDISNIFWLAAFILFCIERFIALRTRKELVYG